MSNRFPPRPPRLRRVMREVEVEDEPVGVPVDVDVEAQPTLTQAEFDMQFQARELVAAHLRTVRRIEDCQDTILTSVNVMRDSVEAMRADMLSLWRKLDALGKRTDDIEESKDMLSWLKKNGKSIALAASILLNFLGGTGVIPPAVATKAIDSVTKLGQ